MPLCLVWLSTYVYLARARFQVSCASRRDGVHRAPVAAAAAGKRNVHVLSRPVGAKHRPGHSLPIQMAQFNTRQTGCCKTTPRPFSSHN